MLATHHEGMACRREHIVSLFDEIERLGQPLRASPVVRLEVERRVPARWNVLDDKCCRERQARPDASTNQEDA